MEGRGAREGGRPPVVTSPLAGSDLSTCLACVWFFWEGGVGGVFFFFALPASSPDANFPKTEFSFCPVRSWGSTKQEAAAGAVVA